MQKPGKTVVKRHGLRTHLVALVVAALLPVIAVGTIAVSAAVDSYRRAFEDRLEGTAAALASAVGSEIEIYTAALAALSTSVSLDSENLDLGAFHQRARWVAEELSSRIFLIDADGRMSLHTDFPYGTDMQARRPVRQTSDVAHKVFETHRPAVGDAITGQMTGRLLTPVYVPVMRSGKAIYALGSVIESKRLSRLLIAQQFDNGVYASLVDSRGSIVARSVEQEQYVGQQVRNWVVDGIRSSHEGVLTGENLVGDRIITAFFRVAQFPGWAVMVAAPNAAFYTSLRTPLATLALGGLGSLALSLVVAARLGHRILEPVDWLTREAEQVAYDGGQVGIGPDAPPVRVHEFERLRAAVIQAQLTLHARTAAVAAGEARLRAVVDTAVDAIVVSDDVGLMRSLNIAAEAIFGHTEAEAIGQSIWTLLPKKGDAKSGSFVTIALAQTRGQRETEGCHKDGSIIPIELSIAEWLDETGTRFLTWIMRDVSVRKADEARRILLAREVDHRAKNVLAVVQSVLRLSPRGDPEAFVTAVESRVAALARVHSLLAEKGWQGADLRTIVERELAAYASPCAGMQDQQQSLALLDGPPVTLEAAMVQPVAMLLHELATNAAKHGAMSVPGGRVTVCWQVDGTPEINKTLLLQWLETGGPPIDGSPMRRSFGSRVIDATVQGQLSGTVERIWEPTGLVVKLLIPLRRIAPDTGQKNVDLSRAV